MPVIRQQYSIPVVRLRRGGHRFELAVHREVMEAYIATGRQEVPTSQQLDDILLDRTVFNNVIKKQDATLREAEKAFGGEDKEQVVHQSSVVEGRGKQEEAALWLAGTLKILQKGELVDDVKSRRERRHELSEAAIRLESMIQQRIVSKWSGAELDDFEFMQLMDAGRRVSGGGDDEQEGSKKTKLKKKEKEHNSGSTPATTTTGGDEERGGEDDIQTKDITEEGDHMGGDDDDDEDEDGEFYPQEPPFKETVIPRWVYKPQNTVNLLQWACHAAHLLAKGNFDKLRRKALHAEVAIRADAKPVALLLQKLCRGKPELVVLKSKREHQDEEELLTDGEQPPAIPTFVYTMICDPAFLELEECSVNDDDPKACLRNAALGTGSNTKTASLEFFNVSDCVDPDDLEMFTQLDVSEPSTQHQEEGILGAQKGGRGGGVEQTKKKQNSKKKEDDDDDEDEDVASRGGAKKKGAGKNEKKTSPSAGGIGALEEVYSQLSTKQLQELCAQEGLKGGGKKKEDFLDLLIDNAEKTGNFKPLVLKSADSSSSKSGEKTSVWTGQAVAKKKPKAEKHARKGPA